MPIEIQQRPAGDAGVSVRVSGTLEFNTVSEACSKVDFAANANKQICIDFEQAQCVDSSAVALCIEWLHRAGASGVKLEFVNLPENLVRLMRVNKVDALFGCGE